MLYKYNMPQLSHITMIHLSVEAPELSIFFSGKLWILIRNPQENLTCHSTAYYPTEGRRKFILGITFQGMFVGNTCQGITSHKVPWEKQVSDRHESESHIPSNACLQQATLICMIFQASRTFLLISEIQKQMNFIYFVFVCSRKIN